MSSVLKQVLKKEFPIVILPRHIKAIEEFKYAWEHKNKHSYALNTPLLGIDKIQFIDSDQNTLFDIFGVDKNLFKKAYHTSEAVFYTKYDDENDKEGKLQLSKVGSDPYNGFSIYLCHLIANSTLPEKLKEQGIGDILSLLHYKFFTSVVGRNFKYPANKDVMMYTIEHLSAMYTIRQTETSTWYLLFKNRAYNIYKPKEIHYNTIRNFDIDKDIIKVISDTQTKVRKFLRNIINEYYANYENDSKIITSNTVNNIDGKKLIQSVNSSYQSVIMNVVGDAININKFIDTNLISLVVSLNKKLKIDSTKKMFTVFSLVAAIQYKAGQSDLIETDKHGNTLYIGYKALLSAIVQKSFRLCVVDGVNMTSSKDILIKIRNVFTSSKIENKDIEDIKNSVSKFIEDNNVTSNISLIPALRIAFILYIILQSFKYV